MDPSASRLAIAGCAVMVLLIACRPTSTNRDAVLLADTGTLHTAFTRNTSLAALGSDTACVLDSYELLVRCHAWSSGDWWSYGRSGEGPGEFQRPSQILAGAEQRLIVNDLALKRVSYFGAGGELRGEVTVPPLTQLVATRDGVLIGAVHQLRDPSAVTVASIAGAGGLTTRTLSLPTTPSQEALAGSVAHLGADRWLLADRNRELWWFSTSDDAPRLVELGSETTGRPGPTEIADWIAGYHRVFGVDPPDGAVKEFEEKDRPVLRPGVDFKVDEAGDVWVATNLGGPDVTTFVVLEGASGRVAERLRVEGLVVGFDLGGSHLHARLLRDDERVELVRFPLPRGGEPT